MTDVPRAGGESSPRRVWLRWVLAIAAAMVIGGFLTGMYVASRYEARLGFVARETHRLREDLRREQATLRERATLYESLDELLRDPSTRVVSLRGTGPNAAAQGRVVWLDTVGGHLFVTKLAPAPEGKAYEVWTIAQGVPRAAGLFQVGASGEAVAKIQSVADSVEAFAVSLEPSAGVTAPSGPFVLASPR